MNEHYFKQKTAFGASIMVQIIMTGADISIGVVVAAMRPPIQNMLVPSTLAIVAG